MDKPRTLPPRVRGKVTGVLDFFVDEIRFFRNILLLTDNFDLVLQVQWWGEVLPVFIRPKKFHVQGRMNENLSVVESHFHSAKYEIKTSLELFKSYLRNSEVLELSVLEAFENYIIGSAFLKDLISLLNNNNETIKMPIFDYLGEEIGEVYFHINYLEKTKQEIKTNQIQKSELLKTNHLGEKPDTFCNANKMKSNFNLGETTIFYNGLSKKNLEDEDLVISQFLINSCDFNKKNKISYSDLRVPVTETGDIFFKNPETNIKPTGGDKESTSCKSLPEVNTLNDSSKVLYFEMSSQQSVLKTNVKKPNSKIINKFNSNSIKCKSKYSGKSGFSDQRKLNVKKPECSKSLIKDFAEMEKPTSVTITSSCEKLASQPFYDLGELKNIPTNKSPNSKVLNYLFGSDMSKDDEQAALNDFKKMSPSHTLVDSINQLCFTSDDGSPKTKTKFKNDSSVSVKQTHLNFDFNNPIERSYYEKFFLKSNSPDDFEVAELLNHPKNSFALEKLKVDDFPQQDNIKKSSNHSEIKESKPDFLANVGVSQRRNGCSRCKYYKKLNELDTIIESLKHFEQKMLVHEKEMQNVYKC